MPATSLFRKSMKPVQSSLFEPDPSLPGGFRYQPDLIPPDQERGLVERFAELPFAAFEFREYVGKRRIVSYGAKYDFSRERLLSTEAIPSFLLPLRERVAAFAELDPAGLQQVLVTEYAAGAAIGWHRDKSVFEEVAGVSLLSPCVFRLRRDTGSGWERASLTLEPRSAYLLAGPSRAEWEHSIPAVSSLRYSVTFRTVRPEWG
ncbi:alpha-ketoglutarate-dependent dioxygenase AlkB [Muricoccus aerilatus]|uniref:alpha-ketoglutarate-dependent dioxygenase AlkB n=1 Tax=Muricoccus aerilatus TaxID=452982 RepID=UPI000AAC7F95|nr:alpha-ketoglutarate-dependent dioxygenase AlkB [Roseomonas aerilata]